MRLLRDFGHKVVDPLRPLNSSNGEPAPCSRRTVKE